MWIILKPELIVQPHFLYNLFTLMSVFLQCNKSSCSSTYNGDYGCQATFPENTELNAQKASYGLRGLGTLCISCIDYFYEKCMLLLCPFGAWQLWSPFTFFVWKEELRHSAKLLICCSMKEIKSYRFGRT